MRKWNTYMDVINPICVAVSNTFHLLENLKWHLSVVHKGVAGRCHSSPLNNVIDNCQRWS